MHGVIVQVELDPARAEEATKLLHEQVVPTVSGLPGFVGGTWMRSVDGAQGRGILVFDTEANAQAAIEGARQGPPGDDPPTTFVAADLFEVMAQA